MSNKTISITEKLYEYLISVSLREDDLLKRLRHETSRDEMARMQISPEQGQFMALLVRLIGAKKVLEVGVYTGYSSLCLARAISGDGCLVACDVSEEWTAIARRYCKEAGVADRIKLHLAPADETLAAFLADGEEGSFDFAFIDADKKNYDCYYEKCMKLMRPGGLLAIDNVLWDGAVIDPAATDPDTTSIRNLK